ncbi:hydroxy-methylpyrimidine kinase and hydroxy-phosphomethylpyrimidine kinase [Erysipelotrichaceae bacterium]|nr:hydroxy-methylpyrimidine kinase and hydroxy-phosphomethylpyrimidine kinase [Erysipelotrichaceae bacterium]
MLKRALTIAGSDASGGAGMQADLKTFQNYDVYGMSALTVLVAMDYQNNWDHQIFPVAIETIKSQISTTLEGLNPDVVKTGMLPSVAIIELVAQQLEIFGKGKKIVIDPVMACKGTAPLFPENTLAILQKLVPLATVLTPNLFEAAQLAKVDPIKTLEDAKKAAIILHSHGAKFVVIKAVPYDDELIAEVVFNGTTFACFTHPKLDSSYNHGAGCTFSASIAAQLAKGKEELQAIADASSYVFSAIAKSEKLNEFTGALVPDRQIFPA